MTIPEFFALEVRRGSWLMHSFVDDLTPAEWTHRPAKDGNCVAHILSHVIVVENMVLTRVTGQAPALPDPEFAKRYGKGASDVGYGYADPATLVPLFDSQRDRLIEAAAGLSPEDYDRPLDHPMFKSIGQLLALVPSHAGLHVGQISAIRRGLGRPPVM